MGTEGLNQWIKIELDKHERLGVWTSQHDYQGGHFRETPQVPLFSGSHPVHVLL